MFSTLFDPHIISYESPRGFVVSKLIMYDETSNPFNHIMNLKQLMTFDMGNDALMCKVFPANLYGPALYRFHRLP